MQDRLDYIVQQILAVAKDKMVLIILYSSYARGDWVKDMYTEDHTTYSYTSDFDFLVEKKGKFKEHATLRVESKIEKRLEQTGLRKAEVFSLEPWISIICESISEVNDKREEGRYFYTDIKNEGILLYDSGEQLARAKNLPWSEVKEMAKEDYEYWCGRGKSFFIDCKYPLERGDFSKSAVELHIKLLESIYSNILLVFARYKPKLHDIRKLGGYCANL